MQLKLTHGPLTRALFNFAMDAQFTGHSQASMEQRDHASHLFGEVKLAWNVNPRLINALHRSYDCTWCYVPC